MTHLSNTFAFPQFYSAVYSKRIGGGALSTRSPNALLRWLAWPLKNFATPAASLERRHIVDNRNPITQLLRFHPPGHMDHQQAKFLHPRGPLLPLKHNPLIALPIIGQEGDLEPRRVDAKRWLGTWASTQSFFTRHGYVPPFRPSLDASLTNAPVQLLIGHDA